MTESCSRCSSCGAEIKDEAHYCHRCGVATTEQAGQSSDREGSRLASGPTGSQAPVATGLAGQAVAQGSRPNRFPVRWVAALVIVLVLVGGVAFAIRGTEPTASSDSGLGEGQTAAQDYVGTVGHTWGSPDADRTGRIGGYVVLDTGDEVTADLAAYTRSGERVRLLKTPDGKWAMVGTESETPVAQASVIHPTTGTPLLAEIMRDIRKDAGDPDLAIVIYRAVVQGDFAIVEAELGGDSEDGATVARKWITLELTGDVRWIVRDDFDSLIGEREARREWVYVSGELVRAFFAATPTAQPIDATDVEG